MGAPPQEDSMRRSLAGLSLLVLGFALAPTAAAQSGDYKAARTSFGAPDLQGRWTNQSITNLTRPPGVKLVVTEEEAKAVVNSSFWIKAGEGQEAPVDTSKEPPKGSDARFGDQGYNNFWLDPGTSLARVKGELRTSWITEPASGQVPVSAEARKQIAAYNQRRAGTSYMEGGNFKNPEELPISERCIIGFSGTGGPVMLNPVYNSNYQFVQTPDHVMIMAEMVHDARIIPIAQDRSQAKHKPNVIRQWLGDSVGWYEGDTLVVETRNVHPEQAVAGPIYLSDRGKVTEKFTRAANDQIFYEFKVEDPVFYTQSWGGEIALRAKKEPIYEYACHEGNYSAPGILAGSRVFEAKEAAAKAKAKPVKAIGKRG
jgi:hypothetical protein